MKIRSFSPAILEILTDPRNDSFRSKPYLCPAGVPTIGYGATFYENGRKVKLTDPPITEERAKALMMNTLKPIARYVDTFCRDDINQYQFDAIGDFVFNVGPGAFQRSTLLKMINANPNDPRIGTEFMKWTFGGDGTKNKRDDDGDGLVDEPGEKQRLEGLVYRNTQRVELYFRK